MTYVLSFFLRLVVSFFLPSTPVVVSINERGPDSAVLSQVCVRPDMANGQRGVVNTRDITRVPLPTRAGLPTSRAYRPVRNAVEAYI